MNIIEWSRHSDHEREHAGKRGEPEQYTLQFIAVGPATYDVEGGQPYEMREQHHPRDERRSQSQEDLGKFHTACTLLFALIVLDQELLEFAGAEVEDLEPLEELFFGISRVGEQISF